MSDHRIENEIQAKGLTAPRVSLADLDANIASVEIHKHQTEGGQILRWAIITTRSGFAVVGKPSVAVSPANDNAEIGEKVATDNSRNELWPLMGYHLHQQLHEQQQTKQPTHICKECGALWKLIGKDVFPGSGPSWNLTSGKCGACCDNVAMGGQIKALQPHELRVVVEAAELADKIEKLQAFGKTALYAGLPAEERSRLIAQLGAMELYRDVLQERIANFPKQEQ